MVPRPIRVSFRAFQMPLKQNIKRIGAWTLLPLALIAGYFIILELSGNVHAVVAGQVYRSAQLSARQISGLKDKYAIRSIINLRGPNAGKPWYDDEVAAAASLGIEHVDFGMSSRVLFSQREASALVAIIRAAPKPVLIHCQGGADRSGIASALYLRAIAGSSDDAAEEQLSIRFGHIAIPVVSAAYAMDVSWEALEPWLDGLAAATPMNDIDHDTAIHLQAH